MKNLPIEIDSSVEAGELPKLPEVFSAENLMALYQRVADEVEGEVPEIDSQEGRARIKSLAAKVSSSKTAIDKPIRDYLREVKKFPKMLEVNARESVERFDALRDATLEPLKIAQAKQDETLEWLKGVPAWCNECQQSSLVENVISDIAQIDLESFWPELKKKASTALEAAKLASETTLERLRKEEEQAAELERLRKEAAEREQAERERKIAEAAAEQARLAEQERARKEREQAERAAFESQQRELQAKRDAELAEQRRIEQEEAAKKAAIESEAKAKRDAELAAEAAAKAERERYEAEQAEAKRLAEEREANKEHRIKINRAALVALIGEGLAEDDAKKVITAIAKGLIPNVRIMY